MITILLIALIALDLGLLGLIYFMRREQTAQANTIDELVEERRILEELRQAVQSDLEVTQGTTRETMQRISKIAAEAEQEVKQGGATLAKELETLLTQLSHKFEIPLQELTSKLRALDAMVRKSQTERKLLIKTMQRAEQLTGFFNQKIPYEEILSEIEDKKYTDARAMLAKGLPAGEVAAELNLPLAEVQMVAGLVGRP